MRAALYARVSTLDQEPENQLAELRRYVDARSWPPAVEYIDSAGLGACASGRKLLRERNGAGLVMFGASPSVARMWKLIRLDIVVPSFATEDAAMARLGALELEPGA